MAGSIVMQQSWSSDNVIHSFGLEQEVSYDVNWELEKKYSNERMSFEHFDFSTLCPQTSSELQLFHQCFCHSDGIATCMTVY